MCIQFLYKKKRKKKAKKQHPRAKVGVGLVMRSLQGAGKNLTFDFISRYVIGEQCFQYINKIVLD